MALTGVAQWVGGSSCKPKGLGFDSQSGHQPRLQLGPGQGTYKRQPIDVSLSHQSFSPSLSPSLPLSLKICMSSVEDLRGKKRMLIDSSINLCIMHDQPPEMPGNAAE